MSEIGPVSVEAPEDRRPPHEYGPKQAVCESCGRSLNTYEWRLCRICKNYGEDD
jgi:hypothetical protein